MREERIEKLRLAAGQSGEGASSQIPGWRASTPAAAPVAVRPAPVPAPPIRGSRIFVLITGFGAVLSLLLRVLRPHWFGTSILGWLRRGQQSELQVPAQEGPITIRLSGRRRGRHAGR